jgi:hypothetical protein
MHARTHAQTSANWVSLGDMRWRIGWWSVAVEREAHLSLTLTFTWRAVEVPDEEEGGALRKRKFRSRAHANPLADPQFEYPVSPM